MAEAMLQVYQETLSESYRSVETIDEIGAAGPRSVLIFRYRLVSDAITTLRP